MRFRCCWTSPGRPFRSGSHGHCAAAAVEAGPADPAGWAHREMPLVGMIRVQHAAVATGPIGPGIGHRLPGPEPVGDRVSVELVAHAGEVVVTVENLGEALAEKIRCAVKEAAR